MCIEHKCSKCKLVISADLFSIRKSNSSRKTCNHYSYCIECDREYKREYQIKNREKMNASREKYRIKNIDKWRRYNHERRARLVNADGQFTEQDITNILINQSGRCNKCAKELTKYEIDHIVPLAKNGSNWPSNLQLLCRPCNRHKSAKIETNGTTETNPLSKETNL